MITPPMILAAAVGIVLGLLVGFFVASGRAERRSAQEKRQAQDEASRILSQAREDAAKARKDGELEGRETSIRLRETWEQEEAPSCCAM